MRASCSLVALQHGTARPALCLPADSITWHFVHVMLPCKCTASVPCHVLNDTSCVCPAMHADHQHVLRYCPHDDHYHSLDVVPHLLPFLPPEAQNSTCQPQCQPMPTAGTLSHTWRAFAAYMTGFSARESSPREREAAHHANLAGKVRLGDLFSLVGAFLPSD